MVKNAGKKNCGKVVIFKKLPCYKKKSVYKYSVDTW